MGGVIVDIILKKGILPKIFKLAVYVKDLIIDNFEYFYTFSTKESQNAVKTYNHIMW